MILAVRIVGPPVPPAVLFVAAVVVCACLVTRWVAPFVLRMVASALRGTVAVAAMLLIFPEYCWSARRRRDDRIPPTCAYAYGDAIGRTTFWIGRVLSAVLHGAAETIRSVPLPLVAVPAGLFAAAMSVGLIVLR